MAATSEHESLDFANIARCPRSGSGSIRVGMRVSQPPYRAVPHRTALNRSVQNRTELCVRCAISGTLEVRSKFAQGTVQVRYGCGTGAVRVRYVTLTFL